MDRIAERLSEWFGSTPFILSHVIWFTLWLACGLPLALLTLIVSLEAIFLSLFILRAENVQNGRVERLARRIEEISKEDLKATQRVERLIKKEFKDWYQR